MGMMSCLTGVSSIRLCSQPESIKAKDDWFNREQGKRKGLLLFKLPTGSFLTDGLSLLTGWDKRQQNDRSLHNIETPDFMQHCLSSRDSWAWPICIGSPVPSSTGLESTGGPGGETELHGEYTLRLDQVFHVFCCLYRWPLRLIPPGFWAHPCRIVHLLIIHPMPEKKSALSASEFQAEAVTKVWNPIEKSATNWSTYFKLKKFYE